MRREPLLRRAALIAAQGVLLSGPTVLAFFAGGYFDSQRAVAGIVAWALVAVALLLEPRGLPTATPARVALGGLALLAAWTLASITWAAIAGYAYHAGQIAVLYLGALVAASVLLRRRAARLWTEPVLAAGALVVIGYGLSERMLPGVLSFARSVSAEGRLEQPLTYWNAMGEMAAIGLVLCARLAGDFARPRGLRVVAAAASAPLGLGLYLSFSRGALFAALAGLVALVVIARRREQLGSALLAAVAAALAAAASAPFAGVTALSGTISARERDGAIVLAALIIVMLAAGLAQRSLISRLREGALLLPRRAPVMAAAAICAALAVAILVGSKESSVQPQPLSGGATRLVTLQSNRYAYWRVALKVFAMHPLNGIGAGNWTVYWLRYRHVSEFATDAHSLPLQTMAELGLVGLALLLALLGGIGAAGAQALRAGASAAGPLAALTTYIAHAPLDWDWQMPALTLVAIVLAGMVLGQAGQVAETAVRP